MKNLVVKFDEIFNKVQTINNKKWYEVFDSELFYTVEDIIQNEVFNGDYNKMISNTEYKNWIDEMADEL